MLKLTIDESETYNEKNQEFITAPAVTLELEHSLFSLSKWESKWEVPFLSDKPLTDEQTIDYIRCMIRTPDVPPGTFERLNQEHINAVQNHIAAKMTATWFNESGEGKSAKEVVTAEVIYYWMVQLAIPFDCEHWHLNKLITLVQVCNRKNQPEKKTPKGDVMARNKALNEARKAKYNTSG